jgi:hypothetical protein
VIQRLENLETRALFSTQGDTPPMSLTSAVSGHSSPTARWTVFPHFEYEDIANCYKVTGRNSVVVAKAVEKEALPRLGPSAPDG